LLFDAGGRLVASSDPSLIQATVEPGLPQALAGSPARGVEFSPLLNSEVAYVAEPVKDGSQIVGVVQLAYTLAEIDSALRELRLRIIAAVLALALLAALLGIELSRRITDPLDRLRDAARDLAQGQTGRRVPEDTPAELASVARSFNRLAQSLEDAEKTRQVTFANIAHSTAWPKTLHCEAAWPITCSARFNTCAVSRTICSSWQLMKGAASN
jgi:HAMP domain-containing protein